MHRSNGTWGGNRSAPIAQLSLSADRGAQIELHGSRRADRGARIEVHSLTAHGGGSIGTDRATVVVGGSRCTDRAARIEARGSRRADRGAQSHSTWGGVDRHRSRNCCCRRIEVHRSSCTDRATVMPADLGAQSHSTWAMEKNVVHDDNPFIFHGGQDCFEVAWAES